MEWRELFSMKYFISDSQGSFLKSPRAKIYSLASRMKCKLLLPQFFSGLAQLFDDLLFAHPFKRRRSFGYAFSQLVPEFFGFRFLNIRLHDNHHLQSQYIIGASASQIKSILRKTWEENTMKKTLSLLRAKTDAARIN